MQKWKLTVPWNVGLVVPQYPDNLEATNGWIRIVNMATNNRTSGMQAQDTMHIVDSTSIACCKL